MTKLKYFSRFKLRDGNSQNSTGFSINYGFGSFTWSVYVVLISSPFSHEHMINSVNKCIAKVVTQAFPSELGSGQGDKNANWAKIVSFDQNWFDFE